MGNNGDHEAHRRGWAAAGVHKWESSGGDGGTGGDMGGIGAPGCGLSRWWDGGVSPDRDRWQAGGSWALLLAGETEKSLDQDWGAGGRRGRWPGVQPWGRGHTWAYLRTTCTALTPGCSSLWVWSKPEERKGERSEEGATSACPTRWRPPPDKAPSPRAGKLRPRTLLCRPGETGVAVGSGEGLASLENARESTAKP